MLRGMDLPQSLRIQAHANRLANRRLEAALASLTRAEFHAPRVGFFPSLAATLNHILAVDLFYVGALHGDANLAAHYGSFMLADDIAVLAERQRSSDERLISFCDRLDAAGCDVRPSQWTAAKVASSANSQATCRPICSCTRPITAVKHMPCSRARPSRRHSSTNS
jgi:uncharacterized damage-inducible protein DinB